MATNKLLFLLLTSLKENDFRNSSDIIFWKCELSNLYYNLSDNILKDEAIFIINSLMNELDEIINIKVQKEICSILNNLLNDIKGD